MAKSAERAADGTLVLSQLEGQVGRTIRLAHPAPALSLPAQVAGAGVEEHATAAYTWHGLHREREDLVVIQHTLAGGGFLEFGGLRQRSTPGTTLVVPVPHDHRYGCLDGEPWRFCWLILTGREAVRAIRHLVDRRGPLLRLPPQGQALGILATTCREALAGGWESPFTGSARAWTLVMALLADGSSSDGPTASNDDPVALAQQFARSHLGDGVGIAAMARAAGLSRFHFSRKFVRATGQTPVAWLADLRLREAMSLLRGGADVTAAGERTGFQDPSYFCRAFRRATGLTPGAYRAGQDPRHDGPLPAANHPPA